MLVQFVNGIPLQLLTLVNQATGDIVMSQYVLTDGVDSTTFALMEGHGGEKVRIEVRNRDTVYSESEFNAKIEGIIISY